MIGYYVHHVGAGHAHRAAAVATHLTETVVGLSSLEMPTFWTAPWVELPRDDLDDNAPDPTAHGQLHWVPLGDQGLSRRMASIATWIDTNRPRVFVVDVSVEVALLARLMGVPVVTIVLPGDRTDSAHQLCFRMCDAVVAPWPRLTDTMCLGLDEHRAKVHYVGGLSRFDGRATTPPPRRRRVLMLNGAGGSTSPRRVPLSTPWDWRVRGPGAWSEDIWRDLCQSDVVVAHAGLGAISDIAAARRPAVLLPEARPHAEQVGTAEALRSEKLAIVLDDPPEDTQWSALLDRAARSDASRWASWGTGDAAQALARIIRDTASTC